MEKSQPWERAAGQRAPKTPDTISPEAAVREASHRGIFPEVPGEFYDQPIPRRTRERLSTHFMRTKVASNSAGFRRLDTYGRARATIAALTNCGSFKF